MTNEQRVRVDRLERYLIADKINLYTTVRTDDLDTVLSLIKEQDKYIKDANDITTEMSNDIKKLTSEIKKKDKQIDLMAKYWNASLSMCDNCDKIVEKYEENNCQDCIKQYFVGLVEKE